MTSGQVRDSVVVFCFQTNNEAATKHVSVHGFRMNDGRQGWLLDTPGFDDTARSDTEILREIASALAELYSKDVSTFALYFHRIVDPRMGLSATRNLELFKLICGEKAMRGVMIVTTRWDGMEEGSPQWEAAVERERQLEQSDKYWAGMIRHGAGVRRHVGTRNSAAGIIDSLVQRHQSYVLSIQVELAKEGLPLDQTAVGRFLAKEQEDLQARYEQELLDLEEEKKEALQQKDKELAAELATQEQKYRAQHANFASARSDLQVNLRDMREDNALKLGQGASSKGEASDQIKAQVDLLTHNVAELQEDMERRDREHNEQIARLRKQARNRDREHELETIRLIEQMEASHARDKRRRMETLRKPRPERREEEGDFIDAVNDSFMKVIRWIGGWSGPSLPR
jgi:hypothetical protein